MGSNSTRGRRRSAAALIALVLVLAACGAATPSAGGGGEVTMISTQLGPEEEQGVMRNEILADFEGDVNFVASGEAGVIAQQIEAQGEAGSGDASLIGALHGEFSAYAAEDYLTDVSDVLDELGDVGINEQFLGLGKLGTDQQLYIPWMQATYLMAARSEALDYLPDGADINNLTWDQVTEWGANIQAGEGDRKLGFPAGPEGLIHRLFQGYLYPAFTGGLNTTFSGTDAVAMWDWLADTWQYANPQSTTYSEMSTPLQSGEVWVAWDHTARLITALQDQPDDIVAFPIPAGPKGTAYMPVVAGLGIPSWAPNPDGAKELIRYLLQPETQSTTLAEVAFFPVVTGELPGDLDPGTQAEQDAVTATTSRSDALPSLLPVGMGDQDAAYSQVFKDAFQAIILDGQDPAETLAGLKEDLQALFDAAEAACWQPDPESDGTCQVQ